MNGLETGIRNFRRRLVVGIRDTVMASINNPQGFARMIGIPAAEMGTVADLTPDQRQALAAIVARAVDQGFHHFLYGFDNQADGFEIRYDGTILNEEGLYHLTDSALPPFADESEFDAAGAPKQ